MGHIGTADAGDGGCAGGGSAEVAVRLAGSRPTTFEVLVAGPRGSGTDAFLSQISDTPVVRAGAVSGRGGADAGGPPMGALGVGTLHVADPAGDVDLVVRCVGDHRQRRGIEAAAVTMDAFVLLVDGADPGTWPEAVALLQELHRTGEVPWMIGVCGVGDVSVAANVGDLIEPGAGGRSRPVAAHDPCSVAAVLSELLVLVGEAMVGLPDRREEPVGAR